jgi:LacI family transcriptional regulator
VIAGYHPHTVSPRFRTGEPRLVDVAKAAGVSVSSASLALSGKGRISDEVRARIVEAAENLGYRPSTKSRQKDGVSAVLALMDRSWAYALGMNQLILDSLSRSLVSTGREICIVPVFEDDPADRIWKRVLALGVDSVFSIHYGNADLFSRFEQHGLPVVVIMNNNFQTDFNSVCVDDYQGAYEAGSILIASGHQRLAYVSMDLPYLTAVRRDRFIGFRKAIEEHHIHFDDRLQRMCSVHGTEDVDRAIDDLFLADEPTALFAMDDYLGVRIYLACKRRGMRIPEDLSIICAGDVLDYTEEYVPNLSTMSIPFGSMGRVAAELMESTLSNGHAATQHDVVKVKQHYVDRGTVSNIEPSS